MFITLSLAVAISLFIYTLYLIYLRKYQYWIKKNVPCPRPLPILGNFSEYILQKDNVGSITQKLCRKFPSAPYIGAFYGTEPTLIVQDPDLIKLVMTKDFYFFSGREISKYSHKELLVQNLFFSGGDKWKVLRQNLTPLFSSAKMKNMFHLIEKCSRVLESVLDKDTKASNVIEARALMARFTMDCVGSSAFGVDTNTQNQRKENPFNDIAGVIFDSQSLRGVKNVTRAIWPAIFYGLGLQIFPREVEKFFYELLTGIFEGRQYKPSTRNDFVDLILKIWNNKEISGDSLSNMKSGERKKANFDVNTEMLVSQCFSLFAAGYETSSTSLGFTLFELAKNPEAQEKLMQEVDSYLSRHNNVINYECISQIPYLEACLDEALRLYPVLAVLTREVIEDYVFPNGLMLEKGIRVHIPVYHLHHNPEYFPDPNKYRPERFLSEEKRKVKPYTYMPFGEGPRICIGKCKTYSINSLKEF